MYLIHQILFSYIFSAGLERTRLSARRRAGWIAGFAALSILLERANTVDPGVSEAASFLKGSPVSILATLVVCLLVFGLISIWILRTRRVKASEAVYAAALGYPSQHACYCLNTLAEILFLKQMAAGPKTVISWAVTLATAAVVYRFVAVPMLHGGHYVAQNTGTAILMAVMILTVIILSAAASAFSFVPFHCSYALILCIYILVSQLERQNALAGENEAKVREQLLVTQKAQYRIYQENAELLNRKSHDLRHAVQALRHMRGEGGEEALDSIEQTVRIYDSFVRTGNDGLDTILTQKNGICDEHDILFTCICDGKCLEGMDQVDLFTLMGNLMDNAIEAVMDLPADRRSISLYVKEEKGMVCIREENPCGKRRTEDGRFVTTKDDAVNHGYGLRSMELVAEKYDGTLTAGVREGVFSLLITLFIPQP